MRVAFFVAAFPVISETFILRQITGLLDLGHEVHVYAERSPAEPDQPTHPEFQAYDLQKRVTYLDSEMPAASGYWCMPVWPIQGETWIPGAEQPIPNMQRILDALPTLQACLDTVPQLTIQALDPDQYGSEALSLEALYHLASLQRQGGDYDIVHAHFGPIGQAFRFVRALWGVPLVVTFWGYDFSAVPRLHGSDIYRQLFQDADGVMAVSEYAARRLEQLGCSRSKIAVVPTGIDPSQYHPFERHADRGEPVRVLIVGRLTEKKGIEYALRAIAKVRQKHPRICCEVIGDGALRAQLERLIQQLGLFPVVKLLGAVDSARVRERMDNAHIFLLPSVTAADGDEEGIPVSLMEAMASGLPVLSTRHSGIPELIEDGQCGFLVPERDVDALADRLLYLIEHSEIWPVLGNEGRKVVSTKFDTGALNRKLVGVYTQAISSYRRGTAMAETSVAQGVD